MGDENFTLRGKFARYFPRLMNSGDPWYSANKRPARVPRTLKAAIFELTRLFWDCTIFITFMGKKNNQKNPVQSGPQEKKPKKIPDFLIPVVIVCIAFVIRIVHLAVIKNTPLNVPDFIMDAAFYLDNANAIVKGDLLYPKSMYSSPLYQFFLAPFLLIGKTPQAALIGQVFLDTVNTALVFYLCRNIFKDLIAAVFGSACYALYGLAIFYSGVPLDTTLAAFLGLLFFAMLMKAWDGKQFIWWLSSGIIGGLLLATKTNVILFLIVIGLWSILRKRGIQFLVLVCGIFIALAPFSFRAYKITGKWSPFPTHGGINFYVGNNPDASGKYQPISGISNEPIRQINDSIRIVSDKLGRTVSPEEASSYWFNQGINFVKADPKGAGILYLKKILLFWGKEEIASNTNYSFCRKFSRVLSLPLIGFGFIGPLALAAIFTVWRRKKDAEKLLTVFTICYMFSVIALFITDRFRFPIVPLLCVSASGFIYMVIEDLRVRNVAGVIKSALSIIVAFGIVYVSPYKSGASAEAVDHNNLGNLCMGKGDFEGAIREYETALKINPNYSVGYFNMGNAYDEKGQKDKAIGFYEKALKIDPAYADPRYNKALILKERKLPDLAVKELKELIRHTPSYAKAYYTMGNIFFEKGDIAQAINLFEAAVKYEPSYARAWFNLGNTYDLSGNKVKARHCFEQALKYQPDNAKAIARLKDLR